MCWFSNHIAATMNERVLDSLVKRDGLFNNPNFNPVEFDGIRMQAGLNSFTLTPKQWIAKTGAIGLISKAGRYGGTYAHKDIAFEFASWVSVEFKPYLIKERLKRLNKIAIHQMTILTGDDRMRLPGVENESD